MFRRGSAFYGWWYTAIGIGFLLLAAQRYLIGGVLWLIVLRIVIATGFLLLGYFELKSRRKAQ